MPIVRAVAALMTPKLLEENLGLSAAESSGLCFTNSLG
jgi:hypothetical protein